MLKLFKAEMIPIGCQCFTVLYRVQWGSFNHALACLKRWLGCGTHVVWPYVVFQRFRKLSRGRVPKQTSPSAVRGIYSWYGGECSWTAEPSDRKRWWIKNKREKGLRKDKARSRTHINIGSAFQHERTQAAEGLRSDAEVAVVLLNR